MELIIDISDKENIAEINAAGENDMVFLLKKSGIKADKVTIINEDDE